MIKYRQMKFVGTQMWLIRMEWTLVNEMNNWKQKTKQELIQRRLSVTTPRQRLKYDGRLASIPIRFESIPVCDGVRALLYSVSSSIAAEKRNKGED